MLRARPIVLLLGVPGLLGFGTAVCAQWRASFFMAEARDLERGRRTTEASRPSPEFVASKEAALARAAHFAPDDPEPAYQCALFNLVLAESTSLSSSEGSSSLGGGPSPELQGYLRESLRSINRAIWLNPGNAEYQFVKATILQNFQGTPAGGDMDLPEQAVSRSLRRAEQLDPYKSSLQYRIGSFWLALGDRERAKRSLTVALTDSNQYAAAVFDLLWSTVERPEELRSFVGDEPLARAMLGDFLWSHGRPEQAEEEFTAVEKVGRLGPETTEILIGHCLRTRQFERARKAISSVEGNGGYLPDFNRARLEYFRGETFFQQGRYQDAIHYFERSLTIDPEVIQSHLQLAAAYLEEGQPEKAIARWQYVLSHWPQLPSGVMGPGQIHFGMGRAYEAMGEMKRALAEYLRASSEDPGNLDFNRKASELTRGL